MPEGTIRDVTSRTWRTSKIHLRGSLHALEFILHIGPVLAHTYVKFAFSFTGVKQTVT